MATKFVKCPKCGVRNFADDSVCGICNTSFDVLPEQLESLPASKLSDSIKLASPQRKYKTSFDVLHGQLKKPSAFKLSDNIKLAQKKAQVNSKSLFRMAMIFIVICIATYLVFSNNTPNNKEEVSTANVIVYLKTSDYLKDPESYKPISWSEVVKLNDVKEIGFASYQVRHEYRAKNSFGAYTVENKLFKLDYQGNVVEVRDWQY